MKVSLKRTFKHEMQGHSDAACQESSTPGEVLPSLLSCLPWPDTTAGLFWVKLGHRTGGCYPNAWLYRVCSLSFTSSSSWAVPWAVTTKLCFLLYKHEAAFSCHANRTARAVSSSFFEAQLSIITVNLRIRLAVLFAFKRG